MLSSSLHRSSSCFFLLWASFNSAEIIKHKITREREERTTDWTEIESELLCSVPGWREKKESNIDAESAASVHSTELTPLLNLGHHLFILLPVFLCLLSWLGRQVTAHANTHTVSNYVLLHYSCWAILECIKRTSGQEAACVYGVNTAAYIPVNSTYCLFNMLQTLDDPFFFFSSFPVFLNHLADVVLVAG